MTLEILVSSALMGYTMDEQTRILKSIEEGSDLPTARLKKGAEKVMEVFNDWEPVVEGYAGFPVEREAIQKKKDQHKDDRNVGRVVSQGGSQYVITGKKSDGRYIVVGKKGEKTAKDAGDIGVTKNESVVGIDIEDLHNMMLEGLKQARKNVGASTCWDGYKAKGTKKKGGKEVPNCVKEEEVNIRGNNSAEQKKRLEKKRGMKLDDHPQFKKEDVEQVDELYKGKHGQSEKEYQRGRSDAGKMVSGDDKMSGSKYAQGRRTGSDAGPQPAGGSKKPQSQGKMDSGTRTDLMYRKAALKKKAAEMKSEDVSLGKSSASLEIPEEMSPQEVQLQKKKATIDKMIAQRRKVELAKGNAPTKTMGEGKGDPCWDTHEMKGMKKKGNRMVPNCVPKEEVELDERTRFAKETGKDFKTGNPSEKGGTRTGKTPFDKVSREMRKTGGMMSSRKNAIQPQGKKKEKGKKGYQGVTPVDRIKNKLAQKRKPKPDPYGYGQGRYQGD